jgi:hypothetical protein
MDELAGKRVFDDRTGASTLLVGAALGLVRVSVADDRVGEFGVVEDCSPADIAVATDPGPSGRCHFVVATDEDVLLGELDGLEPSGFGPAVAVTVHDGRPLAAGPGGRLAAYDDGWTDLGELPGPATALDGDLVGTAEGVLRLVDDELRPAGLADVTDVARAAGMPLVATGAGLYELGNGWLDVLNGPFSLVAGAPNGRAHAVGTDRCYRRTDSGWEPLALPVDGTVTAAAYGSRTYLLTDGGDLLIEDGDGWSHHPLGLEAVTAVVAV